MPFEPEVIRNNNGAKRKSCFFCKHIDYYEGGECGEGAGFWCNNREYRSHYEESKHLQQLESDGYMNTAKKCCELIEDK